MVKDWYSLAAVWHFRPNHIEFVCLYYDVLIDGKWPEKHSGYIDGPGGQKPTIKPGAFFEPVISLVAEFHWRIDQCGDDGKLFRAFKLYKYDLELLKTIVKGRIDIEWVERRCKRVRDYIKGIGKNGLDRRFQNYKNFSHYWGEK